MDLKFSNILEPRKNKDDTIKAETPSKKEKLISQLNKLKEENISLQKENQEISKTIEDLEKKLALIEKNTRPVELESTFARTVTNLSCHICKCKSEDVYEFDAHRWVENEDDEPDTSVHTLEDKDWKKCTIPLIVIFAAKLVNKKLMS